MKIQSRHFFIAAASAALLALQACGTTTVSKGVTDEGRAAEVLFPTVGNDVGLPGGTFPNLDNLRAIGPGVSKDQIYDLVGRPHFREGMGGAREWDYLFHFRSAGGAVTTCQYKVIFDKEFKGQSFHWQPSSCANILAAQPLPVAVIAVPSKVRKASLEADGLFRFDGGKAADLLPEGGRKIEVLASDIKRDFKTLRSIKVVGHTDRLGSSAYNQELSRTRANTVRDLLIQQGIDAKFIHAEWVGEKSPVVDCPGTSATPELVSCLQPNRRVDIEVSGEE